MKRINIWVKLQGFSQADVETHVEVEDDATQEEVDEAVKNAVLEEIDYWTDEV